MTDRKKTDKETPGDGSATARDVAVVVGPTEDHQGYQVLRQRENRPVEFGEVRPLRQGRPIEGEIIALKSRKDQPLVHDVTVHYDPHEADASSGGSTGRPAKVASPQYRRGWEQIFGDPDDGFTAIPSDGSGMN